MIKIDRNFSPVWLSPDKVRELTCKYKSTGDDVWNNENIKRALLLLTGDKCAYCECNLKLHGSYMEVEHFEDKDRNPDKVVCWENLLPSCKRCNVCKGTHDVIAEPIINPCVDFPNVHMAFKLYFIVGVTDVGKETVECLDLNCLDKLVSARFLIGSQVIQSIKDLTEKYNAALISGRGIKRKNAVNSMRKLLATCAPSSEYSCVSATILCNDKGFSDLQNLMNAHGDWNQELSEYYDIAKIHAMHLK